MAENPDFTLRPLALVSILLLAGCLQPGPAPSPEVTDPPVVTGCVEGATQLCACTTGDLGAQICDGDGAYGACDCATPPTVGGVTFLVEDADGSTTTGVDLLHIVGTTDCVQPLGSVEITNDGAEPSSVELTVDGTFPQIVLSPESPITVEPGSPVTVEITFDCNLLPEFPPEPIQTSVTVSSTADATDAIQFPLTLLFEGA